jgi:hypothetical protein
MVVAFPKSKSLTLSGFPAVHDVTQIGETTRVSINSLSCKNPTKEGILLLCLNLKLGLLAAELSKPFGSGGGGQE